MEKACKEVKTCKVTNTDNEEKCKAAAGKCDEDANAAKA